LLAIELTVDRVVALDWGFAREPERPFDDERLGGEALLLDRFDALLVRWAMRHPLP